MSLWNIFQSKGRIGSLHRRTHKIPNRIQRASFCTCEKGSYTLEAAVVIPLISAYLVTILFFFTILDIQCKVDEALIFAGRKAAVESSIVESEELIFLSAQAYVLYALKEDEIIQKYVEHGSLGIHLWKSEIQDETIILRAEYVVKLQFTFGSIGELKLSSQNMFRKWIGDGTIEEQGEYVYVTLYGEVYHKDLTCRSINLSVKSTTLEKVFYLRGKNGQKYKECTRCTWEDSTKERVYYTDYGEWYHKNIACSAIKRTVEKIQMEEIGNRRPCSFCYEK